MSQATLTERPYVNSGLFSTHYLDERLPDTDEWGCDKRAREVMGDLQSLYELEGQLVTSYGEDALIDNWIEEVLDTLGFGTQAEVTLPEADGYVDSLLFETPKKRREAAQVYLDTQDTTDLFERGIGLLEAKQWDADFTQRFSEQRPYYNASQQIKRYLGKTPANIQWGILTNGRKWRLYGTNEYEEQIYYEVDLPELLERGGVEEFKYFYLFFRPEALRKSGNESFLDEVWAESETASQELGEDLQDNVFTALRVLGRGFVESNNTLDIDPNDDEALDELKDQSLVLLYRLMFVLYAESRNLIHPDNPAAVDEYEANFSLDELRLDIHDQIGEVDEGFEDEFSNHSTTMWSRIEDLSRLIDEGEEALGIPPYNGGLFNSDSHTFLANHEISNRYLGEVIYRLSTTQNDEGRYVLADYGDLDTRHLGSVYEGLLEHQFEIADEEMAAVAEDGGQVWKPATDVSVSEAVDKVPQGELYVVNDQGERKSTGAYYTPNYVVTYIVEETVAPLVDDIRDDLVDQGFERGTQEYLGPFLQRITDLKILDPAMGSGHFLTKATGYLSQQVMEEVREVETEMGVAFDEQHIRREIAKECIYGVDINGMAVELAKLSMWLETLATDRPLAFLDHHLKAGNSLVGSDITDVLSNDAEENTGQITLGQAFARVRQKTLGHVMDLMQDLLAIDNDELSDIKSMEELYGEIRDDPLYQRLFEVANVHTAEQFGVDVPEGVYEDMAGAIDDADEWAEIREEDWFRSAQALAGEQSFFHWELEYPEVFFDEDGEKLDGGGFDAVIGNPPWVNIGRQSGNEDIVGYMKNTFETAEYQVDLYTLFLEKSVNIVGNEKYVGMIVPDPWLNNYRTPKIRELLLVENNPIKIISTPVSAFPDVGAEHLIGVFRHEGDSNSAFDRGELDDSGNVEVFDEYPTSLLKEDEEYIVYSHSNVSTAISQIESSSNELGDMYETIRGVGPYHHNHQEKHIIENRSYHSNEQEDKTFVPELKGKHLSRYNIDWEGDTWISYGDWLAEPREKRFFEGKRLLLREILGDRFEVAVIEKEFVADRGIYIALQGDQEIDLNFVLAILGSSVPVFWYREKYNEDDELFPKLRVAHFEMLPIPDIPIDESERDDEFIEGLKEEYNKNRISKVKDSVIEHMSETGAEINVHDFLAETAQEQSSLHTKRGELNLSLRDHLGSYSDGPTLADIGLTQPPSGSADSIVQQTASEKPNLRVGKASVVRETDNTVEVQLTARYKPSEQDDLNEDDFETDQWGYTETDPQPALRITDLTEAEADLIEAFVPVAVDEAGGFADFRETATKTNSLVDRLRKLTLPALSDVEAGLDSYIQTKERAEELEKKIERTDDLIDEIVYELYGLTDEEIEIVEEAVSGN